MDTHNFGESFYVSDRNERLDQFPDTPVANPDPVAGEAPGLPTLIENTPVGVPTSGAGPLDETVAHEEKTSEVTPYPAPLPLEEENPAPVPPSATVPYPAPPAFVTAPEDAPKSAASAGLLDPQEAVHLRTRWSEIQGKFVDEPRAAVQQADVLVAEVVEKITQMFATEHHSLEQQWKEGHDVSTEDLRKALQHYRSFFNRLVV